MIDIKEAMNAFRAKFEKMTYEEREKFLKEIGFSFDDEYEEDIKKNKKFLKEDKIKKL